MKIGIINDLPMLESLNYLFSGFEKILKQHETFCRPPEYLHASKARRQEMTKELILKSDFIVGTMDEMLLETRERVGKHIPYVWFPFGSATRGFPELRTHGQYFKSTDVITCHCEAEVEITRKFFTNAELRYIPFVYDDSLFYPLEESARQQAKAAMGFGPDDKVLLYVGRIVIEKNIQTLLKVFSVVQRVVPNVHLVVAGRSFEHPFVEFGVFPVSMRNTLARMAAKLGVPEGRVHFIGSKGPDELRALYNVADVVSNLTLNHDENFGLAQVEAMACGTPVVGTNWGGLKDTIVEGETGHKVSTFASASLGVKADWWEGLCRIVSVLTDEDGARRRLRRRSHERAHARFSFGPYSRVMESVLADALALAGREGEPLGLTPFGREFFETCVPMLGSLPSYRRNEQTLRLYRELITPFTGSSHGDGQAGQLSPAQLLCLASPVTMNDDGTVSVDDLIYPLQLALPPAHAETIHATLEAMREEPVVTVERLRDTYLARRPDAAEALLWMLDAGLVLRTAASSAGVTPADLGTRMSTPLYTIHRVSPAVDAVVVG